MKILGIETSCDETAAAVVENGTKVLSNVIASSADIHIATGGIVPENAARRQVESIIPVIQKSLQDAFPKYSSLKSQISKLDAIGVTYGPGLIGSLLVGVETAKTLSYLWDKPIINVNHLVAHIYANFVSETNNEKLKTKSLPKFPALALVVSGGHTDLVIMKGHGDIQWISGTRDDAAGECFDKCARLLGLPYPGGPAISVAANTYFKDLGSNIYNLDLFPRPMINSKNFDFSFSGLKTSVLNYTKQNSSFDTNYLAAEIQEAIADVLIKKSIKAIKKYKPKSFLLSGGVAANKRLREKLSLEIKNSSATIDLRIPKVGLCTDNAVVIASSAYYNQLKIPWKSVSANPQLSISGRI